MTMGLKGDKIGASVAPGKKHNSGVRVDGANGLTDSIKNQKASSSLCLHQNPQLASSGVMAA